jgi:hypothetical protein
LERQGNRLLPRTPESYDYHINGFVGWLRAEHPHVRQLKDVSLDHARAYRAELATQPSKRGRPRAEDTLQDSHRAIRTFLRWAVDDGHRIDPGC